MQASTTAYFPLESQPEVKALTDTQGITLPVPTTLPLKINSLYCRPENSDTAHKGSWGLAGVSTSEQFKRLRTDNSLPKAKRWDSLLTPESIARKGSSLKHAARFLATPGLISLGGGLPSGQYFPFDELRIDIPAISSTVEDAATSSVASTVASANTSTTSLQHDLELSRSEKPKGAKTLISRRHDLAEGKSIFDINTAFNYGQGSGSAQLLRFVTEHTELIHNPPYKDWASNLNIGSTSGLDCTLRMLCRRGDTLITEMYTFPTAIETAAPLGIKVIGAQVDEEGIIPDELSKMLSEWTTLKPGLPKPRVVYVIPTGQNPTGATMGHQRRKDIYKICQEHDLFILEDEPYFFLQMPLYGASEEATPTDRKVFLQSLIPSFLSMDVDGRVMRLDSFSKVISPGSRVGWVTGPEQLIERYRMAVDCSTQGPSGMAQLILFKLLDEHWGHEGYIDWLRYIRQEYTSRRDVMMQACEKYLPRDVVSWTPPRAGMFHWMKIDWSKHPMAKEKTLDEIEDRVFMRSIEHGALVMKGSFFVADEDVEQKDLFFRATYAAAPSDQIDQAIQRFGAAVREEFLIG